MAVLLPMFIMAPTVMEVLLTAAMADIGDGNTQWGAITICILVATAGLAAEEEAGVVLMGS